MNKKASSVKTNISINFTWWDTSGRLPDESVIDELHASAIQQVANGILMGETRGALESSLTSDDGRSQTYQGEWDLEPNWRMKRRRS